MIKNNAEAVRHDWSLPPLREGHAPDPLLLEKRARAAGTISSDAKYVEALFGNVRCLVIEPEGHAEGTVLYLHGGGYRLGSPIAYIDYAQRLVFATGRRLVMPFYRLSPEYPFPAALHDAVAVYRALKDAAHIVVAGDSAGGGLAAALCMVAARAGSPPSGAIMVSPMLDLTAQSESYDRNAARDPLFSRKAVLDAAELYLQDHPCHDPLVSPLNADLACFPPALLLVGGAEVLLDEALDFSRRMALADRRVALHVAPGMGHVWPLMAPQSEEASDAFVAMGNFAKALKLADSRDSM